MVTTPAKNHDGDMNETPPEVDAGFDPHKVRGIAGVKRSSDDRIVAGVCSGVARFLNIDPVILRVILVALTFVGFAGVILYVAAWFFLPSEDELRSIAAQWFKLDDNEEQVRVVGLIVAGILAVTAGAGNVNGNWNGPFPWFGLLVLAVLYVWVIRPARRRKEHAVPVPATVQTADGRTITEVLPTKPPKPPKTRWSPVLALITISTSLIAMGAVALYADAHHALPWTTYAVTALGVIAIGLLVGSFWGNGGILIPIGALIAIALAMSVLLPSARIGRDVFPEDTTSVRSSYTLGVGELDLNLNQLSNPAILDGRTIKVTVGVGQTRIVVPLGTNVEVRSTLHAGKIAVFGRRVNGTENTLNYPADVAGAPKLTLDISQAIGDIEVIKQ